MERVESLFDVVQGLEVFLGGVFGSSPHISFQGWPSAHTPAVQPRGAGNDFSSGFASRKGETEVKQAERTFVVGKPEPGMVPMAREGGGFVPPSGPLVWRARDVTVDCALGNRTATDSQTGALLRVSSPKTHVTRLVGPLTFRTPITSLPLM